MRDTKTNGHGAGTACAHLEALQKERHLTDREEIKMAERINEWKAAFSLALGAVSAFLGWFGWLAVLYVGCMAVDWLTGSAAAMRNGQWASEKARDGIWHKVGSGVVVMVSAGADLLIGSVVNNIPGIQLPFTYGVMLCPVV